VATDRKPGRKRWVRVCRSFEEAEDADLEFWLAMTGEERVWALEELREELLGANQQRLRRTARVVRR
jgi:hypothetical protein